MFGKVLNFFDKHGLTVLIITMTASSTAKFINELRAARAVSRMEKDANTLHEAAIKMKTITDGGGSILFTNANIIAADKTKVVCKGCDEKPYNT